MDRDHFWLNVRQFARLAPHLPTDTRGKPRVDDCRVISGIVACAEVRLPLGGCAARLGPAQDALQPLRSLGAQGVWLEIFHALAADGPPAEVLIDSSAVKAHRCASGGKGGNAIRRLAARAAGGPQKSTR
jgi:transposase